VGRRCATEYLELRTEIPSQAHAIKQPGGPEAREEVRLLPACLPAAPRPSQQLRICISASSPSCSTDSCHRLRLHRHLLPVPAAKELRPGPVFRLLSRVESSPDLIRTALRFRIIHTTPCSSIPFSILVLDAWSTLSYCLFRFIWQPFRILITRLRPSLDPCSVCFVYIHSTVHD
jgi:hypothetical protein